VLASLAAGDTAKEILADFPSLPHSPIVIPSEARNLLFRG
jgi:hypothetical protein